MEPSNDNPMPTKSRSPLGCLIILIIIAVISAVFLLKTDKPTHQAIGKKMPALDLVPLTGPGQPVTLDQLEGKVVMVNFWATWCGPCMIELPHIDDLYKHFATRDDFLLLAVSCDDENIAALRHKIRALFEQENLVLPTYADPQGITREAFHKVDNWQGAIPMTFVLDRSGIIRKVWPGYYPGQEKDMKATVEQLLNK